MAKIATAATETLHYVEETVYGTTPATPTWTPFPLNSSSTIALTKDAITSNKLRADGQTEDSRHGNRQVGGNTPGDFEYGSYDDVLEAGCMGTWASDVLKLGVTRRSFTLERKLDLDTDEYIRTTGCEVNSVSISIQPNAMVTFDAEWTGKDLSVSTSQVASSTYSASGNVKPFDSYTCTVLEGGGSNAEMTGLDIKIERGIQPAFVLGSKTSIQGAEGKCMVTGTATFFYTGSTTWAKFIDEVESDITVTLEDPDGNTTEIDLPRVKYNSGNPEGGGEGPQTLSMDFEALYDPTAGSSIVFTRAAA